MNGKGTYYYNNKHKYTGEFRNGSKNGKGKYIDEKGNIYDGGLNFCCLLYSNRMNG